MATLISTPQDLDNIRNNLSGDYELANDIDMASWGNFEPIGQTSPYFTGIIDGKGHVIKNLSVRSDVMRVGFIGSLQGGAIKNLGLENVDIETDQRYVGGLAGHNNGTISNCYVTGNVKQTNTSQYYVGGLVGQTGGIIENSYSDCTVSGGNNVGGLIGYGSGANSQITYSYSKSKVSGTSNVGVFYGSVNTNTGYTPLFSWNYYDSQIGSNDSRSGITGKTTEQMKQQSTYYPWDFINTWGIDEGVSYPYLMAFQEPLPKQESRHITSHAKPIQSNVNVQTYTYQPPQTVTRQVNSHVDTLSSHLEQFVATSRYVKGYLSPIYSNVTTDVKSGKIEVRNVSSFIDPIYSKLGIEIYRQPLSVTRYVKGHLSPLQAHTDVLRSIGYIPVYATIDVLQHGSMTSYMQNKTNIYHIKNPSYCEVVK